MATLKDIRKRIGSVRNTQKITKAMKMVAAAKLRRAQNRLIQARPYANKINEVLQNMSSFLIDGRSGQPHLLFKEREKVKTAEFLILTSDRGLCGGFNGNLLRRAENFIREKQTEAEEVKISVFGRRGRDFFRSRKRETDPVLVGMSEVVPFDQVLKLAHDLIDGYQQEKFDVFYLVYNYFRSAISQEIRIEKLLPFTRPSSQNASETYVPEYLYEPSRREIVEKLVPHSLATTIRRAFLESVAGEYAARMVAMDNATNNSSDMIHSLTLQMNRLRQAAITKELMDIVNGAESLK